MSKSSLYNKLVEIKEAIGNIKRLSSQASRIESSVETLLNYHVAERSKRVFFDKQNGVDGAVSPSDSARDLALFLALNRMQSSAQLLQDLWVLWETREKENGFFVEFGATNGRTLSNTYLLEKKYHWRGILAEPLPFWHQALSRRSATIDKRCVWSETGKELKFIAAYIPEFSGLVDVAGDDFNAKDRENAREITVETVSLYDLLKQNNAPPIIDFLSVDTEGSEYEILSHFDFSAYKIRFIAVEHNFVEPKRQEIHDLLARHGYVRKFEEFSAYDDWYANP